jgi:hypothetical protein
VRGNFFWGSTRLFWGPKEENGVEKWAEKTTTGHRQEKFA